MQALPRPRLYKSKAADDIKATQTRRSYRVNGADPVVGDYVGMVGLLASTCGTLLSANAEYALVEWHRVDGPFPQRYISCYCRTGDLKKAYPAMVQAMLTARYT